MTNGIVAPSPGALTEFLAPGIRLVRLPFKLEPCEEEAKRAADLLHKRLSINETLDGKERPAQPRYKYNDFKLLRFGDRLRIEMGYRSGRTAERGFVPMIAGPITDIKFSFADAGAQLTISGEDDLSSLKDKQKNRVEFSKHRKISTEL